MRQHADKSAPQRQVLSIAFWLIEGIVCASFAARYAYKHLEEGAAIFSLTQRDTVVVFSRTKIDRSFYILISSIELRQTLFDNIVDGSNFPTQGFNEFNGLRYKKLNVFYLAGQQLFLFPYRVCRAEEVLRCMFWRATSLFSSFREVELHFFFLHKTRLLWSDTFDVVRK